MAMSSSPQRTTRDTPRSSPRTTPKPRRTPLQERTRSEANQMLPRTRSDPKLSGEARNVYTATPFPTKPQQILLPSTLRKQKSSQNLVADVFSTKDAPTARRESQL
ncbi:MAG: hypothetical protein M1823_007725, partial [Watsoniomyces obsoletus]